MADGAGDGLRIAHPLVDELHDGIAVHRSSHRVTPFGEARADFLREAALAGIHPVVVTPEDGRVTAPLAEMLARVGATWLAELPGGGFVDGLRGRILGSLSDVLTEPSGDEPASVAGQGRC